MINKETEDLKNTPLVSIIIPCYNYGKYVEEAIDSVLNQTIKKIEIIVVDDGSTDPNTIKILKNLKKPKTKIIHQENQTQAIARNNGIKISKGKYICCLDADDKLEPTYLEECIIRMEMENLDVCSTWLREFEDSDGIWITEDLDVEKIIHQNTLLCGSVFTKEIWEKTGGYKRKSINGFEDWEFWITIAEHGGRGKVIPKPLFLYRRHGVTMIDKSLKKRKELVKSIKELHPELYKNKTYLQKIKKEQEKEYINKKPFEGIKNIGMDPEKVFFNIYSEYASLSTRTTTLEKKIKDMEIDCIEKEHEAHKINHQIENLTIEIEKINKELEKITNEKKELSKKIKSIEQSRSYRFINKVRKDYLDKIVSPDTRLKIYSRKKR